MTTLYHITNRENLLSIAKNGMRPNSYWSSSLDLADYYKETVEDEGHLPIILTVDLNKLKELVIEPDYPGIEEPICTKLDKSDEDVWDEWERSGQTWIDSMRIIHSLRVRDSINATNIYVLDEFGGECPLIGYAALIKTKDLSNIVRMNTWLHDCDMDIVNVLHMESTHTISIYADNINGADCIMLCCPTIKNLENPKNITSLDPESKYIGGNFYKIMDAWKTINLDFDYNNMNDANHS